MKLAIGEETKSAGDAAESAEQIAQPQPPSAPSSKLGFSVEMAFPLSARVGE
jgi:hypothetical protein